MKKRKKRTKVNQNRGNDSFSKRNQLVLSSIFDDLELKRQRKRKSDWLRSIEDHRRKDWTFGNTYRKFNGEPADVRVQRPRERGLMASRLAFDDPRRVIVCERRKRRREVLFSLGRTGKGKGKRRHKWTEDSHIVCKRR